MVPVVKELWSNESTPGVPLIAHSVKWCDGNASKGLWEFREGPVEYTYSRGAGQK